MCSVTICCARVDMWHPEMLCRSRQKWSHLRPVAATCRWRPAPSSCTLPESTISDKPTRSECGSKRFDLRVQIQRCSIYRGRYANSHNIPVFSLDCLYGKPRRICGIICLRESASGTLARVRVLYSQQAELSESYTSSTSNS